MREKDWTSVGMRLRLAGSGWVGMVVLVCERGGEAQGRRGSHLPSLKDPGQK